MHSEQRILGSIGNNKCELKFQTSHKSSSTGWGKVTDTDFAFFFSWFLVLIFFRRPPWHTKTNILPKEDRSVPKKTLQFSPKFEVDEHVFSNATQVGFFIMELILRTFALGPFGHRNAWGRMSFCWLPGFQDASFPYPKWRVYPPPGLTWSSFGHLSSPSGYIYIYIIDTYCYTQLILMLMIES